MAQEFAISNAKHSNSQSKQDEISFRQAKKTDGLAVYKLIERCPPLDTNSSYCNFLQCSHFGSTSIAAEMNAEIVGFISGYIIPNQNNTLFVWQVAVDEVARGRGLASRMLKQLAKREYDEPVKFLETTITRDNQASWALFERFAKDLDADLNSTVFLDEEQHFKGEHATEMLVRIGPF